MVVPFLRLRLTLLRNALRVRDRADGARLWAFVALAVVAAALTWLSVVTQYRKLIPLNNFDAGIAALVAVLVPLATFFVPSTVLGVRYGLRFPLSVKQLSLLVPMTSLMSWMGALLIVWLGVQAWLRSPDPVAAIFAIAGTVLFLATLVLVAHIFADLSALWLASPRSQLVRNFVGWLVLVALVPLVAALLLDARTGGPLSVLNELGAGTQFSPFGAALSAVDSFTEGNTAAALVKLGIAFVTLVALSVVWVLQVHFATTHISRPGREVIAQTDLGWFDRFSATPSGVIGARSLVYWIRDPRYRLALAAVPVVVAVSMLSMWLAGAPATIIWVMPLAVVSFFLGWAIHNDVATDSTAIWIHVATDTAGMADRRGRLVPVLFFGLPLIIVGSTLSTLLMGDWRPLPAVIGISTGLLCAGAAVSSTASARWPYPTSRPGESLFIQPQFVGYGAARIQILTVLATLAIASPSLITGFVGIAVQSLPLQLASLVLGVGIGLVTLIIGARVGAASFDREAPDLIALNQVFD